MGFLDALALEAGLRHVGMLGHVLFVDELAGLDLAHGTHYSLQPLSLGNFGLIDKDWLLVGPWLLLLGFKDLVAHSEWKKRYLMVGLKGRCLDY